MVSLLFPAVQPAAQQPLQAHNFVGFGGAEGSCERLGKRIRSVRQACQDCRQRRVKCDGRRPHEGLGEPYCWWTFIQTEMTKISLLNADVLRMHVSFKELPSQAIASINKDLQDWHNQLPNLYRKDLSVEVRRTILATHLLFLGAIMLLYRRIASQFVQHSGIGHRHGILWKPIENTFLNHVDQGVTAATHSFQIYTSCVVLLHSVAQKQVHVFPHSFWEDDLAQARICLDIVSFCGTVDPVALRFQDCLVPIHDNLASYMRHSTSISSPSNPLSLAYIFGIPSTADADRASLSLKLIIILCQPFSNVDSTLGSNDNLSVLWQSFTTQHEQMQGAEPLGWKLDSCPPFQWDP
ncbi:hypothetical protein LZL87_013942 [Fusarium oxysporum]|nr:hypothetical protein LZL87_013942 [Fusarium oxysporum]